MIRDGDRMNRGDDGFSATDMAAIDAIATANGVTNQAIAELARAFGRSNGVTIDQPAPHLGSLVGSASVGFG